MSESLLLADLTIAAQKMVVVDGTMQRFGLVTIDRRDVCGCTQSVDGRSGLDNVLRRKDPLGYNSLTSSLNRYLPVISKLCADTLERRR